MLIDRRTALRQSTALALAAGAAPLWAQQPKEKAPPKDPYADAKLIDGEPAKISPGSFTIAVLPDTQNYSEKYPDTFLAQTRWLVEKKVERNIAAVLHLGDITNRNTPAEWQNAVKALKQLDGHLPAFLSLGNHDYSEGGVCKDRTTRFNDYFSVNAFKSNSTFGGVYDREPARLENSYHLFSTGGRDFLVLCLEFGPRADVVRWANEIAEKHAKREAILVTHAFIYFDDSRYNWAKYGKKQSWNPHGYAVAQATNDDVCDGEELWQQLVAKHNNFILTMNGHVLGDGLGRLVTTTPGGRAIPQVLVNFQMRPKGGDGWLRLLEFRADGHTVEVVDYSPTRNQRNESPQNRFTMSMPKVS